MIIGVGVDLVEISRFKELRVNSNFITRIFSHSEQNLEVQSLAGRFAAREALYKALPYKTIFNLKDIEIINRIDGEPEFVFDNDLLKFFTLNNVHLTISHSSEHAIAMVVIESNA
jgi:holo-[acyl-carrier protein] synthase